MPGMTMVFVPDSKNQQQPGLPGLILVLIRPWRKAIPGWWSEYFASHPALQYRLGAASHNEFGGKDKTAGRAVFSSDPVDE